MNVPTMEPCGRCNGVGLKTVLLTNGQKETKRCWACDGSGMIPVFRKPEPVKKPVPAPTETPKKVQKPASHLNAPMGDLSWIPGRNDKT